MKLKTAALMMAIVVMGTLLSGNVAYALSTRAVIHLTFRVVRPLSLNLNDDEWIGYDASEICSMLFDELKWPFSSTMAVTPDGMVWMGFNVGEGTNGGILRINPSTLNSTHVESEQPTAFSYKISCYPNPFNPATTLTYSIARSSFVTVNVYSITGQKIATLVDEPVSAGEHSVKFDGSDLASGMYFYRFTSKGFEKTGKMILVK